MSRFTIPHAAPDDRVVISRLSVVLEDFRIHHRDAVIAKWLVLAQREVGHMTRSVFFAAVALMLSLGVAPPVQAADYGQATVNPLTLAKQDLEAESRGDAAAALALYGDAAVVQYGGLCWTPCMGKVAIKAELDRRVAAKNEWKIIGEYVSGNVAVVQTELKIGFIEYTGVDHVVVWCIYEVVGDKIAVATLVGQRTDPQTQRFIEYTVSHNK